MREEGPSTAPDAGRHAGPDDVPDHALDAVRDHPRRAARTRRHTLGLPRAFTIAPAGDRAAFLRSAGPEDAVHRLLVVDLASGEERVVADPLLLGVDEDDLPPEERARRERVREQGGGVVAYATDRAVRVAAFALGGRLFVADLVTGAVRAAPVGGPVVDPRPAPDGRAVAFVRHGALHVAALSDALDVTAERCLVAPDDDDVTWGLPDFVAAEEMGRTRGWWWSPDGHHVAVARVDTSPVQRWHIADPANPATAPQVVAYPAAGTPNARVGVAVVDVEHAARRDVVWDDEALPYLVDVVWTGDGPLLLRVQARDQRRLVTLAVDLPDDPTARLHPRPLTESSDEQWVEIVDGVPRWLPDGRLVDVADVDGARRVTLDGVPVTPVDLQVRRVVDVGSDGVLFTASGVDATAVAVHRVGLAHGARPAALTRLDGVADAGGTGAGPVVVERSLDDDAVDVRVAAPAGAVPVRSLAAPLGFAPRVRLLRLGPRALAGALVLPLRWAPADGPLPVLMDPYGGPHAQRVVRRLDAYASAQWFAEQGYAVLIVDGRGTPGRGPAWEREVAGDLASGVLEDQIAGLHAAAEATAALDLGRVAIRGWSFGGYLAALAVLRRPDVFAAAIAGAPVTDWRLYDTHYTERYLGLPQERPDVYARNSLLDDAPALSRPLLLVHGLADDNVVAAHTLRLSSALLAAGRPHRVLPLSGVTHMTPQEVVAENLLRLQADFLADALAPASRLP